MENVGGCVVITLVFWVGNFDDVDCRNLLKGRKFLNC